MINTLKGAAMALLIAGLPIWFWGFTAGKASDTKHQLASLQESTKRTTRQAIAHARELEQFRQQIRIERRQADDLIQQLREENKQFNDWWVTPVPDSRVVWGYAFGLQHRAKR